MPDWKILITDGLEENGLSILRAAGWIDERIGIPPEELTQIVGEYEALIVRSRTKVTAELFNFGARLRVVGGAGVGIDNIDLAAANLHAVTVVNTPMASTQAVAEHSLALMFALARAIPSADAGLKSGLWLKKELLGVEMHGKVLGVIGMGNIGRRQPRKATGLGMTVLGYDSLIVADEIRLRGAGPATLQHLYARSDFISPHAPLSPATRGMINGQALGSTKRRVRL